MQPRNTQLLQGYLVGGPKGRVMCTSPFNHILQQRLLPIVGGQHGDLLSRVAQQAHVLVQCDHILSLCQVLEEVRHWYSLSSPLKVWRVCIPRLCVNVQFHINTQHYIQFKELDLLNVQEVCN